MASYRKLAPMLDPRDRILSFRERHPQVTSVLSQIGLCQMTFFLAITIDRTVERICPNKTRDELWIFDAYLCRFFDVAMPQFIACPSAITLIAATILFFTSIIRLNYHNRDDALLPFFIMGTVDSITDSIEWKRFFASLQMSAPIIIWSSSYFSALFHLIFRRAFPGHYTWLIHAMVNISWIKLLPYSLIRPVIRGLSKRLLMLVGLG